jgi:hypothetical protein
MSPPSLPLSRCHRPAVIGFPLPSLAAAISAFPLPFLAVSATAIFPLPSLLEGGWAPRAGGRGGPPQAGAKWRCVGSGAGGGAGLGVGGVQEGVRD